MNTFGDREAALAYARRHGLPLQARQISTFDRSVRYWELTHWRTGDGEVAKMPEPRWLGGDDIALGLVWECEECGERNSTRAPVCEGCGAIREGEW